MATITDLEKCRIRCVLNKYTATKVNLDEAKWCRLQMLLLTYAPRKLAQFIRKQQAKAKEANKGRAHGGQCPPKKNPGVECPYRAKSAPAACPFNPQQAPANQYANRPPTPPPRQRPDKPPAVLPRYCPGRPPAPPPRPVRPQEPPANQCPFKPKAKSAPVGCPHNLNRQQRNNDNDRIGKHQTC